MKIYKEKLAKEIERKREKEYIDRESKRGELFLGLHTILWPNLCVIENVLLS